MLCVDVNVLIGAFVTDSDRYEQTAEFLAAAATGTEPLGVPDVVASGFLRIMTNRRAVTEPVHPRVAWASIDQLLVQPAVRLLTPGPNHWATFRRLAASIDAKANDVPDAYIAAYVVDNNATLITADRGFARFDGLRWRTVD